MLPGVLANPCTFGVVAGVWIAAECFHLRLPVPMHMSTSRLRRQKRATRGWLSGAVSVLPHIVGPPMPPWFVLNTVLIAPPILGRCLLRLYSGESAMNRYGTASRYWAADLPRFAVFADLVSPRIDLNSPQRPRGSQTLKACARTFMLPIRHGSCFGSSYFSFVHERSACALALVRIVALTYKPTAVGKSWLAAHSPWLKRG